MSWSARLVRHLDKTTRGEIHWGDVSFDDTLRSPFALFEDHGDF
jgi:hypothetical protein